MSEGKQMHTPLPWKIGAYGDICYGASDWSGVPLHTGWAEEAWRDDATAKANAAYIVTACNAFPALVEALKRAVAQLERLGFDGEASGANAALAKAEGRAALAAASTEGGQ